MTIHKTEVEMTEKILGKIDFAEYGRYPDRPFLFGLMLGFSFRGAGCASGSRYTLNISKECRWSGEERAAAMVKNTEFVYDLLSAAGCDYVSGLVGKPVEVVFENNTFKEFRILTEVL